ncbi:RHS repeat-associated core domain-containing protein [Fangia hongkongensis]|uniref:RHS repeat-associated core domain-containing protein n=1 Tax=Fangia hongkongensis TaxID=270495 RepID=UPI00037824BD|nr:RHS repeat-associated core domain-containing protein [Fangia hongkongensis]MBK2124224.1 hypothetical protein [Fangia hongkongensis]
MKVVVLLIIFISTALFNCASATQHNTKAIGVLKLQIVSDPFAFDDAYHETESTTSYLLARYYDENTARFISQDTYRLFNRYSGFSGDPINKFDNNGHHAKRYRKMNHMFEVAQGLGNAIFGVIQAPLFNAPRSLITYFTIGLFMAAGGLNAITEVQGKKTRRHARMPRVIINVLLLGMASSLMTLSKVQVQNGYRVSRQFVGGGIMFGMLSFAFSYGVSAAVAYAVKGGAHKNIYGPMSFVGNMVALALSYKLSDALYQSDVAREEAPLPAIREQLIPDQQQGEDNFVGFDYYRHIGDYQVTHQEVNLLDGEPFQQGDPVVVHQKQNSAQVEGAVSNNNSEYTHPADQAGMEEWAQLKMADGNPVTCMLCRYSGDRWARATASIELQPLGEEQEPD